MREVGRIDGRGKSRRVGDLNGGSGVEEGGVGGAWRFNNGRGGRQHAGSEGEILADIYCTDFPWTPHYYIIVYRERRN